MNITAAAAIPKNKKHIPHADFKFVCFIHYTLNNSEVIAYCKLSAAFGVI